jgi:lipoprotein-releasing system ATP-binding protein
MSEPAIQGQGLVKAYQGQGTQALVLKGVDFSARQGEVVAVVGPSGAGKTTLLYLLGGLAKPSSGSLHLLGQDLLALGDAEAARLRNRSIGFVFQFHHLLPELSALDNVALPRMISGEARRKACAAAAGLLQEVGLAHRASAKPGELSGGEQQRVALARAQSMQPAVLLADEPTGNLDRATAEGVHELLLAAARTRGQAVVIVTHNESLASRADRVVRMQDGCILSQD